MKIDAECTLVRAWLASSSGWLRPSGWLRCLGWLVCVVGFCCFWSSGWLFWLVGFCVVPPGWLFSLVGFVFLFGFHMALSMPSCSPKMLSRYLNALPHCPLDTLMLSLIAFSIP